MTTDVIAYRRRLTLGVLLLVVLVLMTMRHRLPAGLPDDPKMAVESWAAQGGWPAVVIYGMAGTVLGGLGLPPALFIAPMGLLWPLRLALPLAVLSGLGAALAGYGIGRFAGGLLPVAGLPSRLKRYEAWLQHGGFRAVVVLRLLFFLFPPVSWIMGMSRVRIGAFTAGTVVGLLPHTVLFLVTGAGLIPWLLRQPPWAGTGVVLVIAAILVWLARRLPGHESGSTDS